MLRWADAMGLDRAIYVGHSMGGMTLTPVRYSNNLTLIGGYYLGRFAMQHPERVDALMLVSPAGVL